MGKREKKDEDMKPGSSWLTTFADLCTLLLTFFVLLLSMSIVDEQRQRKVLDSLVGAFGFLSGGRSAMGKEKGNDPREFTSPVLRSRAVDVDMLREITMHNNLDENVQILEDENRIVIRLNSKLLFEPGSAVLRPSIKEYLASLGDHLGNKTCEIEIQGHTDLREILHETEVQRFSWLLSTSRAQAVHDFFASRGIDPKRLASHGYSHEHPLRVGTEYQDFFEENRRVDLVIADKTAIPAYLPRVRDKPRSHVSYKNFLFRLMPGGEREGN